MRPQTIRHHNWYRPLPQLLASVGLTVFHQAHQLHPEIQKNRAIRKKETMLSTQL